MSKFNPDKHHRGSIRLEGYDYSCPGAYFVTICAQGRACLFGDTVDCTLNDAGKMVLKIWTNIPNYFPGVSIDEAVVMPNHFHGIIVLDGIQPLRLGDILERLKSLTTKRYIDGVKNFGWPGFSGRLWQRNYYERILDSDAMLENTRNYIRNNPINWINDENHPN